MLDLFADDAPVYFPKWGLAHGKAEIGKWLSELGPTIKNDHAPLFALQFHLLRRRLCGVWGHQPWRASRWAVARGRARMGGGALVRRAEIRDWKIQRCFIYLDPDYAGKDTERYPWLKGKTK